MPNHSQSLQLTACSDLVLSARHGTEGGHTCLDYIPGSVLLGAAAAACLRSGRPFDPDVFLSGKLRFANAYPVDPESTESGSPTLPVPLAWHYPKNGEAKLINGVTCSLDPESPEVSGQMKQLRKGYFDPARVHSGSFPLISTRQTSRMKTAIERGAYGRAAESQLFDYQAIESGQVFLTCIEADRSIDASDFEFIVDALTQSGVRVGRSRSAEFGRVDGARLPASRESAPAEDEAGRIILYLASDLALMRDGSPVLEPSAEDFGLGSAYRLDLAHTFVRTRSFSPWIQFRDGYDIERQVICKGSVITFERVETSGQAAPAVDLQNLLTGGLGLHRAEGCGRVLVNPHFLVNVKSATLEKKVGQAISSASVPHSDSARVPEPPSVLTSLLSHRLTGRLLSLEAEPVAKGWSEIALMLMKKVRGEVGEAPGKTQWAAVRTFASSSADPEKVRKDLEEFFDNSRRKAMWTEEVSDPVFGQRTGSKRGSLANFLVGKDPTSETPPWEQKWFKQVAVRIDSSQRSAFWNRCIALTATHVIRKLNGQESEKKEQAHG
jgi:hypothetical protein